MPTTAFVAVPGIVPPPFPSRVLRPFGMSGLSTYSAFQSDIVQNDEDAADDNSLQDYQNTTTE